MQALCPGAGALPAERLYAEGSARVPGALCACGFAFADADGGANGETQADSRTYGDAEADNHPFADGDGYAHAKADAQADSLAASRAVFCGRGMGDRRFVGKTRAERRSVRSDRNFHAESDAKPASDVGGNAAGKRGVNGNPHADTDSTPNADAQSDADAASYTDAQSDADGKPHTDAASHADISGTAVGTGVRHRLRDASN